MDRREFLKAALLAPIAATAFSRHSWAYQNPKADSDSGKLIVVFLRGGVDGLNVVTPYGDNKYRQLRPTIGMSRGTGLLDLDGYWGLHPSLTALTPYWSNKSLAFVHNCGSPDRTRSHFDAQDYMESGVPGRKAVSTGWLNRLVSQLPSKKSPIQAISLGPVLPRIFAGPADVATIAKAGNPKAARKQRKDIRQGGGGELPKVFADMYGDRSDELGRAFASGSIARSKVDGIMKSAEAEQVEESMTREQMAANRGALTPKMTPQFGKQLATLFTKDPSVQVAFVDFGGWDTHVREGAEEGQLANYLKPLSNGLEDLAKGLGPLFDKTTVVVMSEFGRTVRENGNGGTDHGHGNVMWLLGGGINGGKVYGRFGGLADKDLNEDRDLPTTTDFRAVLSKIFADQLGLSSQQLATVFPDFKASSDPFLQA